MAVAEIVIIEEEVAVWVVVITVSNEEEVEEEVVAVSSMTWAILNDSWVRKVNHQEICMIENNNDKEWLLVAVVASRYQNHSG